MRYSEIKELAQFLRRNQTSAERQLWEVIRKRKVSGYKFIRQHPIIYESINGESFYFIPDFYCAAKKVIIELDGKIHDYQKDRDQHRDEILKAMKLNILHIRNDELVDMKKVISKIENFLKSIP
jgi:leucyl-tRNA synthetase